MSPAHTLAHVEASTEMLRVPPESQENHFEGIATGDEFWFQYSYPSSTMFARSATDVIPRMRQVIRTEKPSGINKSLWWAAVEDLRIHRIHFLSLRKR
jgi:hypothetical protein